MIQRIQSLFLLGVSLISIGLFFIPFSEKTGIDAITGQEYHIELCLSGFFNGTGATDLYSMGLLIINLLILSGSVYTIFLFRNRAAQMRLCMFLGLLATVELILVFYLSDQLEGGSQVHYLTGTYLVAVQVFLLLGARRSIRKDEILVRSADRIR
jgi:hypothetical protein